MYKIRLNKQEIKSKEQGEELDYGPRIPVISDFIDRETERLDGKQFSDDAERRSTDQLNSLFRSALNEVWS
ncbi:MAG: hypothetical protein E3K37_04695 [Candidatus Kuenenia sp.]|nr:hypothetical protein [Candidatus Kuenenia hertensis]